MSVNSHPGGYAAPRKRPVQARSRRSVEAMLDAAAHVLAERGYAAATTNHIAAAAGVSIGSLYQYFPNKDALIVALEERHLDAVGATLAAAAVRWDQHPASPPVWARDLVDTLVAANDSPLHVLIYDAAPPLPQLREAVEAAVEPLVAATASQLRRWGHRRQVELRAQVLVVTVVRLVHDLAVRAPVGRGRDHVRDEIVRTVVAIAAPG